jgi:hypothetical protein
MKDFTDYVTLVFGAGERVYELGHIRQLKKDEPIETFDYNNHTYLLNKDRAMRLKSWAPWRKWDWNHPIFSVTEAFRSKKVGLVVYQEPEPSQPKMESVTKQVPKDFSCKICGFQSSRLSSLKMHCSKKHKAAKHSMIIIPNYETITELVPIIELVEPLHISRKHQPSGRMVGDPVPELQFSPASTDDFYDPNEPSVPPLVDTVSPRVLKAIVDSEQFRKAYKSFKFGNLTPITAKWWLWLVLAIVGVFIFLILTGNFQMPR